MKKGNKNMKKFSALCAALVLAIFALNGFVTLASNQDSFWNEAAQDGLAEINLGSLALQKSQNDEVKQLAQKVVDDHTAANNELTALAAGKNVKLPTDVNAKQKAVYDKLNALSGDQFDMEFVKTLVKDHESAVKLFQKQADSGKDAEVKAFAAKTLPTLQSHLEMAKSMSDKMNGMKNPKKSDDKMNSNSNVDGSMNSNSKSNSDDTMNSNSSDNSMNMNSNSSDKTIDMNSNSSDNSMNMSPSQNTNSNSKSNRKMNSNKSVNSNAPINSNTNSNNPTN
jgi:putative membrane protein